MRISGNLWIFREKRFVVVGVAVVHLKHNEIVRQSSCHGLILMNELVQQTTPTSPISANFQDYALTIPARLAHCRCQVLDRITIRVIFGNDIDRLCNGRILTRI